MEEKELDAMLERKKAPTKRRVKTWGSDGFTGKISYGCYDYHVKFVPQSEIKEIVGGEDDNDIYGAINQFQQIIYIASDSTPQCQKATLLHEIMHAIFLMNGSMCVGNSKEDVEEQMNVQSELLVDRAANGILEIVKRNPEVVRWLSK